MSRSSKTARTATKADKSKRKRRFAASKDKHRAHKKRLADNTRTMKLVWRHATCRVTHTRNYISTGWSHVEITVLTPKGAPLPITETGYKSHFMDEDVLQSAGGPVAFFLTWLDNEAKSKAWAKTDAKWRQLTLPF